MQGDTTSCGCARREVLRARNYKHGRATRGGKDPTYVSWVAMWNRVRSPQEKDANTYAGVSAYPGWAEFEAFLRDMGERPPGTTLDREDGKRGYEPGNCRWATHEQQANNTTRNRRTASGESVSVAARRVGLDPDLVFDRINKLGWSEAKALATPKRRTKPKEILT